MKVLFVNASKRFKEKLNIYGFNYEATLNKQGFFDIVVYPGMIHVDNTGIILKTVDGYSGYVIKMTYDNFSSMIIY